MISIEVESVIVGDKNENQPGLSPVKLELVSENIVVRDLIFRTVKQQIQHHLKNEKKAAEIVKVMLRRQFLSQPEIDEQSKKGKVSIPKNKKSEKSTIDIDKEFKLALSSFNSNTYKLIVDGETMDELDEVVHLQSESSVVFIRLMPLIGG